MMHIIGSEGFIHAQIEQITAIKEMGKNVLLPEKSCDNLPTK
jgi:hypothetical protein